MRHTQLVLQQLAFVLVSINAYGQPAFLSSPRDLLATDPRAVVQWLDANRPKPVPAPDRAVFLSRLPAEGEVVDFDESARRKLDGLTRFLERTERGSVYEIKVVDLAFARLATYEGTAILVSQAVLTLLDGEELQALVAHEIGHEYVADDYNRAFASRDRRRLKDLELLCDAIGTVTLLKLGIDPSRLITAAALCGCGDIVPPCSSPRAVPRHCRKSPPYPSNCGSPSPFRPARMPTRRPHWLRRR